MLKSKVSIITYYRMENFRNGQGSAAREGIHMYHYTLPVSNKNIVEIVKRAFNMVDKRLIGHGSRVSYIVFQMLKAADKYSSREVRDLLILAALHDIGAYKTDEIDRMVEFETNHVWNHSIYGYMFFKYFTPFEKSAPVILFHHTPWEKLKGIDKIAGPLKLSAQLINLADRFDIYLEQAKEYRCYQTFSRHIEGCCPDRYCPEAVALFNKADFSFLFRETSGESAGTLLNDILETEFDKVLEDVPFTEDERNSLLRMMTYAIDFRSPHTVTHTITTTVISSELARIFTGSGPEVNDIICGAMLHDLGKIGIPSEILEFPGKLSPQAMNVMRTHVDLTEIILGDSVTRKVKDIALRHHEKLDGSGYPRGLKGCDLTVPQRIVAIADIVSALTGTRSYKDSFPKEKTCSILNDMAERGLIDSVIVERIVENYDVIMGAVREKATPILEIYQEMQTGYLELLKQLTAYM